MTIDTPSLQPGPWQVIGWDTVLLQQTPDWPKAIRLPPANANAAAAATKAANIFVFSPIIAHLLSGPTQFVIGYVGPRR
jgi:hypothetical protein